MFKETSSEFSCSKAKLTQNTQQGHHVYLIDDDTQFRRSIHFVLSTAGFVVWPFGSAADFLDNLSTLEPAPILLDMRMKEIDGIALMKILDGRGIKWPVIVLTGHADVRSAVEATKLGAIEFFEKPCELELLVTSIYDALAQLARIITEEQFKRNARTLFNCLSRRELDVIVLLMRGLPNKVAAHQLSLSVRTVEMHRANALRKLKVNSIAEAVRLANHASITPANATQLE